MTPRPSGFGISDNQFPGVCRKCGVGYGALDDSEPFPEYWVFCPVCGFKGPVMPTRSESIAAWNRQD